MAVNSITTKKLLIYMPIYSPDDLITIFDTCFKKQFNTKLVGGGDEPIYLPASDSWPYNRIVFTRDYFSSALHEVAHWCIAGEKRRQQVDYGYWYTEDGRTEEQQKRFEVVEVKPQALEWIFNQAIGSRFRLSADNLTAGNTLSTQFAKNVVEQAKQYCLQGINERAHRFLLALQAHYATENPLAPECYSVKSLLV